MISPKGRRIAVQMWGSMPYITKNELNLLLSDLPEPHVMGRSGRPASPPKAARAAICTEKVDLNHMKNELTTDEMKKVRSKYRNLPDTYWEGTSTRSSPRSATTR